MADGVNFSLIGIDELLGKLDSVKNDVRFKGGRYALRKAANLVAEKARSAAARIDDPATGRSIADNIAVRFSSKKFKQTGDIEFRVGVLGGANLYRGGGGKEKGDPTPHWRLIEFGSEKMRAQPFMRTALSENIGAATNEFVTQYERAIDRAIKRAQKKKA